MMDLDPMREALKRRKGKGIDITITVDPEGGVEQKDTDLAPKGEALQGEDEGLGKLMPGQEQEPQLDGEDDLAMLEELTGDMTDYDKQQAMEPGRKPMSLGGRARTDALGRMKQGK